MKKRTCYPIITTNSGARGGQAKNNSGQNLSTYMIEEKMNDEIEDLMSRLRQAIARALIDAEAKGREGKTVSGLIQPCKCGGEADRIKRYDSWYFVCSGCGRQVHIGDYVETCLRKAAKIWNGEE
jgi:hypothetical protein